MAPACAPRLRSQFESARVEASIGIQNLLDAAQDQFRRFLERRSSAVILPQLMMCRSDTVERLNKLPPDVARKRDSSRVHAAVAIVASEEDGRFDDDRVVSDAQQLPDVHAKIAELVRTRTQDAVD